MKMNTSSRHVSWSWKAQRLIGCLVMLLGMLTGCDSPSAETIMINDQSIELQPPKFLQSRAIVSDNLDVLVSMESAGVITRVEQRSGSSLPWVGELMVPRGASFRLSMQWVERQVEGLPDNLNGVLPLATYTTGFISNVTSDQSIVIDADQFDTQGSFSNPMIDFVFGGAFNLDLDNDGFSNLIERRADSNPNKANDIPEDVLILFTASKPVIDGRYDPIWNGAQFLDTRRNTLNIDKILIDNGVTQPGENRGYKWAGMHDGEFLYLMVFGEGDGAQTPFGDSVLTYNDDAVDIFWDGNNSRGASYDGVDDFHVIIPLLSGDGTGRPNVSSADNSRYSQGTNSAIINDGDIEFAVCTCRGARQVYEIKINLALLHIPVGSTIGFEIQLNNDVNGGERDAKWAWYDDKGGDNVWRFPLRMGTARLEPSPID